MVLEMQTNKQGGHCGRQTIVQFSMSGVLFSDFHHQWNIFLKRNFKYIFDIKYLKQSKGLPELRDPPTSNRARLLEGGREGLGRQQRDTSQKPPLEFNKKRLCDETFEKAFIL